MTQDEIIEMALQAGFERLGHTNDDWVCFLEEIEAFAKLVAAKEREACAKMADEYVGQDLEHNFSALVAHNIRARGEA
jgi:hypothetical protein